MVPLLIEDEFARPLQCPGCGKTFALHNLHFVTDTAECPKCPRVRKYSALKKAPSVEDDLHIPPSGITTDFGAGEIRVTAVPEFNAEAAIAMAGFAVYGILLSQQYPAAILITLLAVLGAMILFTRSLITISGSSISIVHSVGKFRRASTFERSAVKNVTLCTRAGRRSARLHSVEINTDRVVSFNNLSQEQCSYLAAFLAKYV